MKQARQSHGLHVLRVYLGDSTYVPPAGPLTNPPDNPDDADYLGGLLNRQYYYVQ
jgi:hypothetical protein